MLQLVKQLFLSIVDNIDAGNSNISEQDCIKIINVIKEYADTDEELSKYQAYTYLNISRANFDNMVREGKLPKGKKIAGFKELRWSRKEIDEYVGRRSKSTDKRK